MQFPVGPADFESVVDQHLRLKLEGSDENWSALVVRVDALAPHTYRSDPFSVTFFVETADALEQGMYTIELAEKGLVGLFLIPRSRKDNVLELEAVFN